MVIVARPDLMYNYFLWRIKFAKYAAPIIIPSIPPQTHQGKILMLFPMVTIMTVIGNIPIPVVQVKVHQETFVSPAP